MWWVKAESSINIKNSFSWVERSCIELSHWVRLSFWVCWVEAEWASLIWSVQSTFISFPRCLDWRLPKEPRIVIVAGIGFPTGLILSWVLIVRRGVVCEPLLGLHASFGSSSWTSWGIMHFGFVVRVAAPMRLVCFREENDLLVSIWAVVTFLLSLDKRSPDRASVAITHIASKWLDCRRMARCCGKIWKVAIQDDNTCVAWIYQGSWAGS